MATTADIKIGMCIELDGKTFQIVDFQHVKPGKGPAFVRTKLKNLESGRVLDNTFSAGSETVLSAELPPIVDMEVTYTEPGIKGDTASTNSLKPATVNTGATVRVPLFINTGDKIRVDTRTREYYERIK